MRSYKILGLMLTYPRAEIWGCGSDWSAILKQENILPKACLSSLHELLMARQRCATNAKAMLGAECDYVSLFDRTRAHSLHLLEHVYGESRERGQAMVDLAQTYESVGLVVQSGELPDYLPLFLEYLSYLPARQASETLAETIDIIAALGQRLAAHRTTEQTPPPPHAAYSAIFEALLALSKTKPSAKATAKAMSRMPQEPQTLDQLDEEWREKEAFSQDDCRSCNTLDNFNRMLEDSHASLKQGDLS